MRLYNFVMHVILPANAFTAVVISACGWDGKEENGNRDKLGISRFTRCVLFPLAIVALAATHYYAGPLPFASWAALLALVGSAITVIYSLRVKPLFEMVDKCSTTGTTAGISITAGIRVASYLVYLIYIADLSAHARTE